MTSHQKTTIDLQEMIESIQKELALKEEFVIKEYKRCSVIAYARDYLHHMNPELGQILELMRIDQFGFTGQRMIPFSVMESLPPCLVIVRGRDDIVTKMVRVGPFMWTNPEDIYRRVLEIIASYTPVKVINYRILGEFRESVNEKGVEVLALLSKGMMDHMKKILGPSFGYHYTGPIHLSVESDIRNPCQLVG